MHLLNKCTEKQIIQLLNNLTFPASFATQVKQVHTETNNTTIKCTEKQIIRVLNNLTFLVSL